MDRLFLIDGSSYFYRAFFGGPKLSTSKGFPTTAIYVFTHMMVKVLKEHRPKYLAIVWDAPGPTFRDELYKDYKAHRPPMPEDLVRQVPHIKRVPPLFAVPTLEISGVEADDVIGTLARRALARGIDTVIVTGDKDFTQLVTKQVNDPAPGIILYDDMKDKLLGIDEVKAKMLVPPERVVDVLALQGDATDNIPGVRGIGEKTAPKLVAEHGGVEDLLGSLDRVEPRVRRLLEQGREDAVLSKRLATIRTDVALEFSPEALRPGEPQRDRLIAFFREFEFSKLLDFWEGPDRAKQRAISFEKYRLVLTPQELDALVRELEDADLLALDTETDSPDPTRARLVGISVCARPGEARYIPTGHVYLGAPKQLPLGDVVARLRPILGDAKMRVVAQNAAFDLLMLERHGVEVANLAFDTMLGAYLVNPDRGPFNLESLSREFLSHEKITFEDLAGRGKAKLTFAEIACDRVRDKSCEDVDVTLQLVPILDERLRRDGLMDLMERIELPLVRVLVDMERAGVGIDAEFLKALSGEFAGRIRTLQAGVYELAGEEFNPDSPKQLQRILFEKLRLEPGRRTQTGFSTDEAVLEKLAADHPLPAAILALRQLKKLKGTYVDALPQMINPETGRVHTSYNQAVAATGRLSSSEPNLQNIPIRTEEGRKIRRAFVPKPGHVLIAADYSQLELRILAHLTGDPGLVRAFKEDRDVHRATAAEVFGTTPDQVTDEMRGRAKAINFGIVYGMSGFGLAQRLKIDQKTAQEYIELYFRRYHGVKEFIERTLKEAEQRGYVSTLFGRRRYVQLATKNRIVRAPQERIAINAPIQGTAADLMKIAMINVWNRYRRERLASKMILQVHDELVVEAPRKEADRAQAILQEEMERVHPMRVPLKVDVSRGPNWADLE
ncbi:MAG: DNA polymerase I [Planctomycetes bacterium]|nr:DNA polymerase I [Planctomycetota bacterium]